MGCITCVGQPPRDLGSGARDRPACVLSARTDCRLGVWLLHTAKGSHHMEAGPGPGSAASRADGRNNLQLRSVAALSPLDQPPRSRPKATKDFRTGLCFAKGVYCNGQMALQDGVKTKLALWQPFMVQGRRWVEKKILSKQLLK